MNAMKLLGTLSLLLTCALATAESTSDLKATMFREASQALAEANAVKASIYAPISYADGAENYRNADSRMASGGSIDSIRKYLQEATEQFQKAAAATQIAQVTLPDSIAARNDAENAEAAKFAPEQWGEAERKFATAVQRLEQGSVKSSQRIATEARGMYREAELTAIKANYLDETRALLEQAKDVRAKRYAPVTLKKAEELLAEAAEALDQDRYDTDRPRSLAQEAKYEAKHAIYLSGVGKQLRDGDISSEAAQLQWEEAVRHIADQLDRSIYYDEGPDAAAKSLAETIAALQTARSDAEALAGDRQQQIDSMNQQIAALESRLGGEEASLLRVNAVLAEQDRIRARIQQVEQMFSEDQALVLRKGNDVIVRMVGLNFDTGQAVIKTEHYALLGTLREAFDLFPSSPIVIEGHTDSFGSDATNFELSEKRANAVSEYMKAVAGFNADRLTAVGFGESRPAANNETAEGRKRNRRIDVVISNAGGDGS